MSRGALPWQLDTVVGSPARLLVGALRVVAARPSRGLVLLLAGGVAVACMAPPPPTPTPAPPTPTPVPYGTGPLRASGGKLVDAAGREVRLTGVNWSGLETYAFAPFGL